jgi:hypothetical protein
MNIQHDSRPAHPAWCTAHEDTGDLDDWHRSRPELMILTVSQPGDVHAVEISLAQSSHMGDGREWRTCPAEMLLYVVSGEGRAAVCFNRDELEEHIRLLQGALRALRTGSSPTRVCMDCDRPFAWDESPDDQRCTPCADAHNWHQGAAVTW